MIGKLNWLAFMSRPEIGFTVSDVSSQITTATISYSFNNLDGGHSQGGYIALLTDASGKSSAIIIIIITIK